MSLSTQLANIKSSGLSFFEYDKSLTTNYKNPNLRILIGKSRRGAQNFPVYISNQDDLYRIFGSIDRNLEKKGFFFHRSILAALKKGPVLAMSLEKYEDTDMASIVSVQTELMSKKDKKKENFVMEERINALLDNVGFRYPTEEKMLEATSKFASGAFSFMNISEKPVTIIVKKSENVSKVFKIPVRDYFKGENLPEYIDHRNFVSDYFVDVLIYSGDFTPSKMDLDPVYGGFFTATGLSKSALSDFNNLKTTELIGSYTGCMIPHFKDGEGRDLYIESAINAEWRRTGVYCAIDEDKIYSGTGLDLVGHNQFDAKIKNEKGAKDPNIQQILSYKLDADGLVRKFDMIPYRLNADGEKVKVTLAKGTKGSNRNIKIDSKRSGADKGVGLLLKYTTDNEIENVNDLYIGLKEGDYLKGLEESRVARIVRIWKDITVDKGSDMSFISKSVVWHIETMEHVAALSDVLVNAVDGITEESVLTDNALEYVAPLEDAVTEYVPFILPGYKVREKSLTELLSVLAEDSIKGALTDQDGLEYRYLVDTFGSYDVTNGNLVNKSEMTAIAKERMNVSCIMNAPFVSEFTRSSNPSFKNEFGKFDARFVYDGGNVSMNPKFNWQLPSIEDGATYGYYYGPGLLFREGQKETIVPPAAYVSNNYMTKLESGLPWQIVAGPRRGIVTGNGIVGVEYSFTRHDRDYLEPAGYNSIVFQRGTGLQIMANRTAQTSVQSTLSSAHARECLIYIHNGIRSVLKDYLFEFNTAEVRMDIKTRVDAFLDGIKHNQGLYDYATVMDTTNNTDEVIDNNMAIIDIFVEIVKGMEKIVARTTILNTGEIQTGNFS